MADETDDGRDAEGDSVEFPDEIYADRAPIAAVSVGKKLGTVSTESLHVVCSDGACFKLGIDGEWRELEPVPGTERAGMLPAIPERLIFDEPDGRRMTTKIKPALTDKEWAVKGTGNADVGDDGVLILLSDCGGFPYAEDIRPDRHALAALCLYEQPFGFTREDVDALRRLAERYHGFEGASNLADRIEALLPPRAGE